MHNLSLKNKFDLFWHSLEIKRNRNPRCVFAIVRTYPHVTLKVYSHFVIGMEVKIEEYMEKIG